MLFVNKLKVLTLMTCLVLVGQAFATWDGVSMEAATPQVINDTTYYIIDTEKKLAWFADQVNSKGKVDYNAKLTANLDMSNPDPSKKSLWTPIAAGNNKRNYKGVFDGGKHVVSNLYIAAEELIEKYNNNDMAQNIGFIGCFSGTVKDLILENIDVHGYGKGGIGNESNIVDKPISIGTVVGWQSTNTSRIDGCYATGVVVTSGNGQAVGGIVGNVGGGTVSNCYSAVDIYASGLAFVGGIAGYTKDFVVNNVHGTVSMSSCVYAGKTLSTEGSARVGNKDSSGRAGAIIGYQYKGNVTLSDLYYDASQFPDGGIGAATGGTTTGVTTAQTSPISPEVVCLLNKGSYTNGSCSVNSPWEVGESGPALNEYSADGYKIVFNANNGFFAGNSSTAVKYVKLNNAINGDGIVAPSRDGFAFKGWSANESAVEPDQSLGAATKALTLYAVWNPIFTITFKSTPGSFPVEEGQDPVFEKVVKIENGKKIEVKDFAVPSSYFDETGKKFYFMGWALNANPSEEDALRDEKNLDNLPIATEDITLYAVWTEATVYTVTFDANGRGTTVSYYKKVVYDHETVSPLTDEDVSHAEGYHLNNQNGWCTTPECNSYFDFTKSITENKVVYANWDADEYQISYENVNGVVNPNPTTYTADGLVLQALVREDGSKIFESWCFDENFFDCSSEIAAGKIGDLTLYAKWKDVTYDIIYRAAGSGATGNVSPEKKYHGVDYTILGSGYYSRDGYAQNGWTTTLTGDKVYGFKDTYSANAPLTLYPTWSDPIVYTITYVCDGCTNDPSNRDNYTIETSTFSVKFKDLTPPDGYKMVGWYSAMDYKNKVEQIKKGSFGDTTLYAKLNKIYKITYVGTDKPRCDTLYTVDDNITLRNPADSAGYTFGGWFTNAEFEGDAVTGIAKGSTGDTTFYAKWVPVPYTISYNIDGEPAELTPNTYTAASATELATPTRNGYEFDGWYSNDEYTGDKVTSIAAGSIGDTAFFAKWTAVEYSITYVLGEGASNDNDNPASYTVETDAFTLKDAVKNGYTFEGWFNGEGEKVTTVAGGATGNLELTARFTIETYTITYHNIEGATFETPNPTSYTVEDEFPIVLNEPTKVGFNFLGWFLSEDAEEPKASIAAGSTGDAVFYAKWELAPSPITVTASTEIFEYDAQEHQATCSYEGVVPVGYSIAMTPTGIVQTVGDGNVPTSCNVAFTEDATGDDATDLFSGVLEIVNGTISVKAKVVNYGGVAVITDEDGTRAEIDDGAMTKIDIPNDVPVDHVEFNRNFPLVKYATVVLPFTIDTNKVHGAKFYTVVMQKTDGKWVAGASPVKTTQLTANTPYLIFAQDANLTFDGPVTLNTSEINNTTTVNVNEGCSWTFKGTYEKIVWDKDHPDLKKVYAFSAHDVSDDIKIGKFVKFGAESWIRPMRAYLIYEALPEPGVDPAPSPAAHQYARVFKSMPSTASIEDTDMPEWIDVVIIGDDNEETTPIAQMNSRTGEIRMMDGWFDMKGRKLNAKPTVKGIYYHNGQRIIVK